MTFDPTITRSIRANTGKPPSSPAKICAALPQPRSSKACAADTRAVAGPSSSFTIAASTFTAALECRRASAFTVAAAFDFIVITTPMSWPAYEPAIHECNSHNV